MVNHEITIRPPANDQELQQALALRQQVFVVEEGRDRFVDADDIDHVCDHIVAVCRGEVIGTLRLYLLNPDDTDIKIGRVAVSKQFRGQGIGTAMMSAAHQWAVKRFSSVYLHSQVGVVSFYEKLGYRSEGEVFLEAGTPHIIMRWRGEH